MTDYAEKERQFIASLKADTGRDLAGWMDAISAQSLAHRNDIIDWLRQQRFTFSRASWLERIHHNGGQPIYAEKPDLKALAAEAFDAPSSRPAREPQPAPLPAPPPIVPQPVKPAAAAAAPVRPVAEAAPDLETLLARGKAYRPLAQHLLKAIAAAVSGLGVTPRGGLVALGAPREFGVLAISARDIKLGLALGDAAPRDGLEPARIPGAGPAVTHMVALTDVRRIDQTLLGHVAEAASRAR
jgi:hypothetical protein